MRAVGASVATTIQILQQSTRGGMLLVRAGKEAFGSCSARRASFELAGEQVSDVIHVEAGGIL
jgi:hypothetical protein